MTCYAGQVFLLGWKLRTERGVSAVCGRAHVDWKQDGEPDPGLHLLFFSIASVRKSLHMVTRCQSGRSIRIHFELNWELEIVFWTELRTENRFLNWTELRTENYYFWTEVRTDWTDYFWTELFFLKWIVIFELNWFEAVFIDLNHWPYIWFE